MANPHGANPHGCAGPILLTGDEMPIFMEINQETLKLYQKYGVEDVPGKNSSMNSNKKIQFFLEYLTMYDSGSEKNKNFSDQLKFFLNRRFNNSLQHATDTFEKKELKKLHEQMHLNRVGDLNRK
jgi:hypothetical protein